MTVVCEGVTLHFFCCCQISSSFVANKLLLLFSFVFAWFCEAKSAFLLQVSSSDLQASLLLSAICEMASTVLTFEWQPIFLRAQIPICSPHFGNEKMRFRFCATSIGMSRAKFWLQISPSSTVNKIIASIEYRTSKVKEFSGEFTRLKKIGNTE